MEGILLAMYLLVLSIFDGKERRIPVIWVSVGYLAAVVVVLCRCIQNPVEWKWIVLSAVLGVMPGVVMLAVAYITKGVGYGDGLVLIGVGMLTGYGRCILLISFSLLLMSVWCIGILCCRKGGRSTRVPYLPFLTVIYLISLII